MANSNDWLTPEAFEEAAEHCLEEDGVSVSNISAYQVAKQLGRNANSTVYILFRAWKARKLEEEGGPPPQLAAELIAPLEETIDQFKAQLMAASVDLIGRAIKSIESAASFRVAEAHGLKAQAAAEAGEYLDKWSANEKSLSHAKDQIAALEVKLEGRRVEVARLEGRLNQMEADRDRAFANQIAIEEASNDGVQ